MFTAVSEKTEKQLTETYVQLCGPVILTGSSTVQELLLVLIKMITGDHF